MDKIDLNILKFSIAVIIYFIVLFHIDLKGQSRSEVQIWENYSVSSFNKKHKFWIRSDVGLRQALVQNPQSEHLLTPQLIINIGILMEFIPAVRFQYINDPATY